MQGEILLKDLEIENKVQKEDEVQRMQRMQTMKLKEDFCKRNVK